VQSIYVTAFALTAPSAKNVLDKLLIHFSYFGLPRYISFDCGTHFTSELIKACLERLGVSPRFHCPYNPRAAALVERSNATLKQIISKLIADMPSTWHKVLPFALWSIRMSVNETLGISPYQAVFGQLPRGPLQLLCDHWTGEKPLPLDLAKSPAQYLEQLENKLQLAADYSAEHAAREQTHYVHNYNLRSRYKSFAVGERVIYLMSTSANKLTRTWMGPCEIVRKNSPYSYVIEFNGKRQWTHANHLRKYNERVSQVVSNSCAIVFEVDNDFGDFPTLEMKVEKPDIYVMTSSSTRDGSNPSDRVESSSSSRSHDNSDMWLTRNHKITSVHKPDSSDATIVDLQSRDLLPSVRIKEEQLCHLSPSQRKELFNLLDNFSQCFSDKPGCCPYIENRISVSSNFKPKRL
jgi:hypothetical protein